MRVLLATDGSDGAAIAVELVGNIRWPSGSSIDVVRVVGGGGLEDTVGPWPLGIPTPPNLEATALQGAEELWFVIHFEDRTAFLDRSPPPGPRGRRHSRGFGVDAGPRWIGLRGARRPIAGPGPRGPPADP